MKILILLTTLENKGPAKVVKDIVDNLPDFYDITIGYLDDKVELEFSHKVKLKKLSFTLMPRFFRSFDVVHTQLLRPDLLCFINYFFIKKIVATVHSDLKVDLEISHGKFGYYVSLIWCYILSFYNLIFLTKHQKNKLNIISRKGRTREVIYNGRPKPEPINIDHNLYPDSFKGKAILGTAAHIVKRKSLEQLIKVLKLDEKDGLRVVIVGDGPELNNITQLCHTLEVSEKVHFTGKVLDVLPYLSFFDVYVMTSSSEGMPLALLEAASMSLPIVCSDMDVVQEIFSGDEVNFYKYGDITSLYNSICNSILEKDERVPKIYKRYTMFYTDKVMSESYGVTYQRLGEGNV